ncbi:hypothetical protein [Dolichospermum flos-aquae]|uniref:Uncharacterized protein n=1 Tax=Dolichospermum flos-aquae UHCC 0037 TaxID=2590026 RepID=A0ACC7SAN8_DOLFA|nr:hypothetical protein [Dolichospermum flos-aquae]MTJ45465.1 hypothetical protein [Dolichospermum flos-aquae UHCC 0037]
MATPRFAIRQIKISNSPPKIIQSHPENPQILDILIWLRHASTIRQIKISNSPPKIIQQHPENPQILDILIWLRHASLSDK